MCKKCRNQAILKATGPALWEAYKEGTTMHGPGIILLTIAIESGQGSRKESGEGIAVFVPRASLATHEIIGDREVNKAPIADIEAWIDRAPANAAPVLIIDSGGLTALHTITRRKSPPLTLAA